MNSIPRWSVRAVAAGVIVTAPALLSAQPSQDSDSTRSTRASTPEAPVTTVTVGDRGIVFASPDNSTRLVLRARLQNLAELSTVSTRDLAANEITMAPRRVRLRLDGSIFDPRLTVKLQLSFSRRDQDFDDTQAANVVRDAVVYWRFNPSMQVGFGQTKLPGNRQRVVSSSEMQFAERSIITNRFGIDRDEGFFARVDRSVGSMRTNFQYALSLGEGRNQPRQGPGLAHTGRFEVLPFGSFTDGGDYFEGDLIGERKPKLSLGVTHSVNSRTTRTGGQLGSALWSPRTMSSTLADALFKYRGVAVYAEAARRSADDPITTRAGSPMRYIYTGTGTLLQASWHRANWEPAVRFARTVPDAKVVDEAGAMYQAQASAGLTRYFNRHRIKLQGEVTHNAQRDIRAGLRTQGYIFRINSEVGI